MALTQAQENFAAAYVETGNASDKPFVLRVCWGWFEHNGEWKPNPLIDKTAEEQLAENVKNGFCTIGGRKAWH